MTLSTSTRTWPAYRKGFHDYHRDRGCGRLTGPASTLRSGAESLAAAVGNPETATLARRPPAELLQGLPRAFADSLPRRATRFQARPAEPEAAFMHLAERHLAARAARPGLVALWRPRLATLAPWFAEHLAETRAWRRLMDANQAVPEATTADAVCAALAQVTQVLGIAATVLGGKPDDSFALPGVQSTTAQELLEKTGANPSTADPSGLPRLRAVLADAAQAHAQMDGRRTEIGMEQEPGSSGVMTIDYYRRKILVGYDFRPDKKVGDKQTRANPVSSAAEAGNIWLVAGRWNRDFLDEVSLFPNGAHDDQVDAFSGAFASLAARKARILA